MAIAISVVVFFVLAFVGYFNGVGCFVCGLRAAGGAVGMYVVVNLAGAAAIRIFVDAAVKAHIEQSRAGSERS